MFPGLSKRGGWSWWFMGLDVRRESLKHQIMVSYLLVSVIYQLPLETKLDSSNETLAKMQARY